ncbi:MAG TPA: L-2-hydroxyglutarate oxidase [Acidimicrobiia bacterium]|nr:L-2-hydroxyglutarate oxidase [Acidimicrobiia bacterium]
MKYDVCVVGGGLVGLATARALLEAFPGLALTVVDKEPEVAAHQSSHNSGVVHSGLYYKPGSLKARLCVEGRDAVYELCDRVGIPAARSGKLVIASRESEIPALDELERRGRANGLVGLRRLGPEGIREFEPEAVGVAALHVPEAGIADYPAVARHLAGEIEGAGAAIRTDAAVTRIDHAVGGATVTAGDEELQARVLINCAGLHSDRVAALAGVSAKVRIIPFRGEYYRLSDTAASLVETLIYPVPDPRFPFLGVHFTRKIDGSVEVGPNAVLALGREHYRGTKPDWPEVRGILAHPGFRRLARRHWRSGTSEMMNSRSRRLYARLARRLVPAVHMDDLLPGGSGVRAQAVAADGSLVDDFVFEEVGTTIHVLNAPSPGATASLAIGRHVAERARPLVVGKPSNPQ